MAMLIVQTGAEALEIVVGNGSAERLEPNAQRVVEMPDGVAEVVVRRVAMTEIEDVVLAAVQESGDGGD